MRRFFWFLVVLIVSVWVGLKISQDPGYALFAYRNWTMEMPLWFAAVAFLIILFAIYALLNFFDGIGFSLYRLKNWLRWRRKYKSYNKTNRGLVELVEGQWRSAEYLLLEGVAQSDAPLINYLAAAKAAQELNAFDRRDTYLRKAHDVAPQAEVAIGLTQAQLQFDQAQLEQSLATLGHLRNVAPKQKMVLKLLERVYVRLADWRGLLKLLPNLRKAKIITDEQENIFEENMYQELLRSAATKSEGMVAVQRVWQGMPKKLQKEPSLIYCYAKLLLTYPEMADELEGLVSKAIKRSWDKNLVNLYGQLLTTDPKRQLSNADGWVKQYGNQAILLLMLGRVCMRCQLWGKARGYLEESIKLEPTADAYLEYGRLLEQLSELTNAVQSYKNGLMLVTAST